VQGPLRETLHRFKQGYDDGYEVDDRGDGEGPSDESEGKKGPRA
jgi:hypothetical protein